MNSELSMDQALIEKLITILEVNLDKENFGVKQLAFEAGLSRSQLHRKLNSIVGKSASKFIREFRLKKAMVMLQNNVATASEIAYRVGFSSPTYFNTCFHDYYGYPPGEVKFRNPAINKEKEDSQNLESIKSPQFITEIKTGNKKQLSKRMVWINTFLIILLGVISYNLYQKYQVNDSAGIPVIDNKDKSIAIIPFKNLSLNTDNQYFIDGMIDDILNHLSTIDGLLVKSSQSSEKYRESDKSTIEIGKELDANYLLDGSVQKYKDSIRLIIQLIDAKKDIHLWADSYDFELNQVFAIQSKISHHIANELNAIISPFEEEQLIKTPTDNLEAYNLYLKGRYFWHRRTEEDLNRSIQYYNQAIKLDTTFALAYAGLADTYYVMPWWKNVKDLDSVFNLAKKYAEKTLSIDKNNAEAHATLGGILCFKDWNWEASENELKLAININPNYGTAHQYYAELLEILGRAKEAREQIDLALRLNPNSYIMTQISARLYYKNGLYEKAIIEANKAKELNIKSLGPYFLIVNCYTYLGKNEEAMAEWEEEINLNPNPDLEFNEGLRKAFKTGGVKGYWRVITDSMLNSDHPEKYAFSIASNLAYLGEIEKALDWLELAYEQRSQAIIRIKCNYDFKVLRNEPRFLAILEKLNLGGYE